jgi:hypothetical protein
MGRPCRYCVAAYPEIADEICEMEHRDEQRVYDLATAMARIFQPRPTTDERVQWFLNDADAVADDFDPATEKWRIRKLPGDSSEFIMRFRVNDVTYVLQDGDEKNTPVRLATLRSWQRDADAEAARWLARS